MTSLKKGVKRIPGVSAALRVSARLCDARRLQGCSTEEVFADICRNNRWHGEHSVSGQGSDLNQTEAVRRAIPQVCASFGVKTILDIPCGDFHWMQEVNLAGLHYTGADIVTDLVEANARVRATQTIRFIKLNLIQDDLPPADMIFCRDCIVHFSFRDAMAAFQNISRSAARYLLTTTFPDVRRNHDILTGQWRPLNLQLAPFSFPAPVMLINEGCSEADGAFKDKSLALWRVDQLATQ